MADLLLEILEGVKQAKTEQAFRLSPAQLAEFDQRYDTLLQQGFQANAHLSAGKMNPRNAVVSNKGRSAIC